MISGNAGVGGGLGNVVREISKVLAKNGVQVTIFNSSFRNKREVSQNCITEEVHPFNFLPPMLRFALYDEYAYSLEVWRRMMRLNSFDIIHGHGDSCFFPALFRDRTPFVANIHGIKKAYYSRALGPNSRLLKSPRHFPLFWAEEIAAKRSDVTVAVSKAERDELCTFYGINSAKIKVIYNGVDTNRFRSSNKRTARRILGLPENRNYAIWVGNNPTLKGLGIAMRAVKGLENLYLMVVGISGSNFDNVLFWGMVSDPQKLCALYNAADFLIFPTRYEGFPLVPLEALACGLPIIISKECPTREIITDGVEGFVVDQRKPECYTEKILTILTDHYQNEENSLRRRKLAEKYSWEKAGQEYLRVYLQLIG
jgi:glycosyltransferase involved in cell wall biosynthesis